MWSLVWSGNLWKGHPTADDNSVDNQLVKVMFVPGHSILPEVRLRTGTGIGRGVIACIG